jgi:2-polyprenyl-6-methoxyphenol hydroxylase-like FAD-dependent oxidoreductase
LKILSIGGGPAGLYLGILMKSLNPSHEITVIERNRADDTFGFGVVFSERTLDNIQHGDAATYDAIARHSQLWDTIEVRIGGKTMRCGGNGFSAIARKRLLNILQERATNLGVELRFQTEAMSPSAYANYDLILAADGANSMVRRMYAEQFHPHIGVGKAKYIWFGTTQHFDCLTFPFEQNEHGIFAVHAYPFDDRTSTFIVETDEQSWRNAELDRNVEATLAPGVSDMESMAYCQKLFAKHLDGHKLIVNNSKWLNFRTIKNERWCYENIVLMGDAAHTAHFSVGSGTKMAMEDAIALSQALHQHADIPTALTEYERVRRPEVERIQRASAPSLAWWESFRFYKDLDSEQFAFNFLSRNPRVTYDNLMIRDPNFVMLVDQWFIQKTQDLASDQFSPETHNASDEMPQPFTRPLYLNNMLFKNRLVIAASLNGENQQTLQGNSNGILLLEVAYPHAVEWHRIEEITKRKDMKVGLHPVFTESLENMPDDASRKQLRDDYIAVARLAAIRDIDLFELPHYMPVDMLDAIRAVWPQDKILAMRVIAPANSAAVLNTDEQVEWARMLKAHGCVLISITGAINATRDSRLAQRLLSERIHSEVGIATMMIGGLSTLDEINTFVLGARADLCLVDAVIATNVGA